MRTTAWLAKVSAFSDGLHKTVFAGSGVTLTLCTFAAERPPGGGVDFGILHFRVPDLMPGG